MTNPNKNMLITLGVRDIEKAKIFYTGIGFKIAEDSPRSLCKKYQTEQFIKRGIIIINANAPQPLINSRIFRN